MNRISPGWNVISIYEKTVTGIVWNVWDAQAYEVQALEKQDQFMYCQVIGRHNWMKCYVTVVYGHNALDKRKGFMATHSNLSLNNNRTMEDLT